MKLQIRPETLQKASGEEVADRRSRAGAADSRRREEAVAGVWKRRQAGSDLHRHEEVGAGIG